MAELQTKLVGCREESFTACQKKKERRDEGQANPPKNRAKILLGASIIGCGLYPRCVPLFRPLSYLDGAGSCSSNRDLDLAVRVGRVLSGSPVEHPVDVVLS